MPGISASVSSSILVMANPSPTLSSVTFARVWMRVGVRRSRESCAVSAIVKHPAWAAPINSSGLVAVWPSSNRDLNEYGPSRAPLPTLSRPLPSARLHFHSASSFRVGMAPPFDSLPLVPLHLGRVARATGQCTRLRSARPGGAEGALHGSEDSPYPARIRRAPLTSQ